MSAMILQGYEIGVLDWSKAKPKKRTVVSPGVSALVFGGEYGVTYVPPVNKIQGKIDIVTGIPLKVLFRRAKNYKAALKIGKRFGSVVFCHKVDTSFRFKEVEYIELNQKPMTVEIKQEDQFILNANSELTLTQESMKGILEQKYEIPIDLTRE